MKICCLGISELRLKRKFFAGIWLVLVLLTAAGLSAMVLLLQIGDVIHSFSEEMDLNMVYISERENGKDDGLKESLFQSGYTIARNGCGVSPEDFGLDSYIEMEGEERPRAVYGTAERYLEGRNLRLDHMNELLISGEGYYESDEPLIWLSDYAAEELGVCVGDLLQPVSTEYFLEENETVPAVLVAGIYTLDKNDLRMFFVVNETAYRAVFNPDAIPLEETYILYVPEPEEAAELAETLQQEGVMVTYYSGWTLEIRRLRYVVYLIALCVLLLSLLVLFSLIRTYCNTRKGYYAMLRLLGVRPSRVRFLCCMVWSAVLLAAAPVGTLLAKPVVRHLEELLRKITERAELSSRLISTEGAATVSLLLIGCWLGSVICMPGAGEDLTAYLREERE